MISTIKLGELELQEVIVACTEKMLQLHTDEARIERYTDEARIERLDEIVYKCRKALQ